MGESISSYIFVDCMADSNGGFNASHITATVINCDADNNISAEVRNSECGQDDSSA
jgi:PBP1b-binding outer membrane lipoprotein LpoB